MSIDVEQQLESLAADMWQHSEPISMSDLRHSVERHTAPGPVRASQWTRRRWVVAGCAAAVFGTGAVLVVFADHSTRDGARGDRGGLVMRSAVQPELGFGELPAGWPVTFSNPANVVCVEAIEIGGGLRCDHLAGYTSTWVGSSPSASTDESEAAATVRTIYTTDDVQSYLASTSSAFGSTSGTEPVTVRGHDGVRFSQGGLDVVVWQEGNGTLGAVAVGPVKTAGFTDPVTVAEQLRPGPLDISELSLVAVSLDPQPVAEPSGAEILYRTIDNRECVGIGAIEVEGEPVTCLGDQPLVWATGTVSPPRDTADPLNDLDAVGGLVDAAARTVTITQTDGATIQVATMPVPGTTTRAWGTRLDRPQGAPFHGTISTQDDHGDTLTSGPLDFVRPIDSTDRFCYLPGTTGIVPDVVGVGVYDAAAALIDAGLTTARPIVAPAATKVTSQDPAPGTDVGCGDVQLEYGGSQEPTAATTSIPATTPTVTSPASTGEVIATVPEPQAALTQACARAGQASEAVPIAAFVDPTDARRIICWADGHVFKSPPPGPDGSTRPDFDRLVYTATKDGFFLDLLEAGYRDQMTVSPP